jgi:hypothetical protein
MNQKKTDSLRENTARGFPRNRVRVIVWAAPGRIFIAPALSPHNWLLLRRIAGEFEQELSQAEPDRLAAEPSEALKQAVAKLFNNG